MTKKKSPRLFKVSKELNLAVPTLVEYLNSKGFELSDTGPNTKITEEMYEVLLEAFAEDYEKAKKHEDRVQKIKEAQKEISPDERVTIEEVLASEKETTEVVEVVEVPEEEAEEVVAGTPEVESEEAVVEAVPQEEVPAVETMAEEAIEGEAVATEVEETTVEEETPVPEAAEVEEAVEESVEEPASLEEVEEVSEKTEEKEEEPEVIRAADHLQQKGLKIVGKIDLKTDGEAKRETKRRRRRKRKGEPVPEGEELSKQLTSALTGEAPKRERKKKKKQRRVDEHEVEEALQKTMREMEKSGARTRKRRRRQRREEREQERELMEAREEFEAKKLRVVEFLSTGELAEAMGVPVTDVIQKGFELGMMITINQRLDADTITLLADEFGYDVEFITDMSEEDIVLEEDRPEDLVPRPPVVTVMGHVDHGKTSLLDYIRKTNVVAGEAGGITQHIGAYVVELDEDKKITFLDTPGHEAFTAMRARGAQVTDVVILVVAADDAVMPQTIEAINHARAAGVPMVVAINKIDKPGANPDRVMQQLSEQGVLCEQWGGPVQCALVSAKTGEGIDELLEKVLLEAEMLELKANPKRKALGTIIESRLDKGRGIVATVLVQNGTLHVGDPFVAGLHSGRVRAMFDERDRRIKEAGPSTPALVLGFDGQPEVGDRLIVVDSEREAREIAQRRQRIWREQKMHQRKHVTLDDISRRMALGNLKELNIIIKADVAGSAEALSDALMKLSTDEVRVNIIHSGVGAITESDVMLATASDAIIIGFQVRPTAGARKLAEQEEIDIRLYSVIYDAIEDVRDALEGLLEPEESEKVTGLAEVRETFKVPKVGTVAGCYVLEGKIRRNDRVRVIRDGVVIYEGRLASLKRFKEDVREVQSGYECGLAIENFNDIKIGDQIEAYEVVETKRKLEAKA